MTTIDPLTVATVVDRLESLPGAGPIDQETRAAVREVVDR